MSGVRDRISQFIKAIHMTTVDFEKSIGVSNGYISSISKSIQPDKLDIISDKYPDLSIEWLLIGKGEMLKPTSSIIPIKNELPETRPRIPYAAAAGSLTSSVNGVTDMQCEQIPIITAFPSYDFTILIKGDSMYPNYEGGDEVACKRIDNTSFIQWGKVHVMDTAQGIVIKRVYEDGEDVRCVSYNKEYPDFTISKREIYSMSLVVGLLRL